MARVTHQGKIELLMPHDYRPPDSEGDSIIIGRHMDPKEISVSMCSVERYLLVLRGIRMNL